MGEAVVQAEAESEGDGLLDGWGECVVRIGVEDFAEGPDGAAVEDSAVGEVAKFRAAEPAFAFREPFTGFEHAVAEGPGRVVFAAALGIGEGKVFGRRVLGSEEVGDDFAEQAAAVVRGRRSGLLQEAVEDRQVSGVIGECVGPEVVRPAVLRVTVPWMIVGGIEPAVLNRSKRKCLTIR